MLLNKQVQPTTQLTVHKTVHWIVKHKHCCKVHHLLYGCTQWCWPITTHQSCCNIFLHIISTHSVRIMVEDTCVSNNNKYTTTTTSILQQQTHRYPRPKHHPGAQHKPHPIHYRPPRHHPLHHHQPRHHPTPMVGTVLPPHQFCTAAAATEEHSIARLGGTGSP